MRVSQDSLFEEYQKRGNEIYLSKTEFIDFLKCPYTWFLKKKLGRKTIVTSKSLEGNTLHNIARVINVSYRTTENIDKYVMSLSIEEGLSEGVKNFTNFVKMKERNLEEPFPTVLNGRVMSEVLIVVKYDEIFYLKGHLDAVYRHGELFEIVEYKKSFYKDISDFWVELNFYGYIFEKSYLKKVDKVSLFSFSNGSYISLPFSLDDILSKIDFVTNEIKKENFVPLPSLDKCRFCLYRNNCSYRV